MRSVVLAGDNNTAPGTRNTAVQPLSATLVTEQPAKFNVESTAARRQADSIHRRTPIPPTPRTPLGQGPARAPERLAKGGNITGSKQDKYNQSQAQFISRFDLARLQGPTLGQIYKPIKPVATMSYADRAQIGAAIAAGTTVPTPLRDTTRARAEKLLKLTTDAVTQFGADYQPLLDEAQDILGVIAAATLSGAEVPPSVSVRLDVLERGVSGQLGERVGLTRGVSATGIRGIVTDVVTTVAGPLGPQVAALATIVADLATKIKESNDVIADLVAASVAAVVDAAAAGDLSTGLAAATGAIAAIAPSVGRAGVNEATVRLEKIARGVFDQQYKDTMAAIAVSHNPKVTTGDKSANRRIREEIEAAKAAGPAAVAALPYDSWKAAAPNITKTGVVSKLVDEDRSRRTVAAKKVRDDALASLMKDIADIKASVPKGAPVV